MSRRHSIGQGVLTWDKAERQSDRYGYVYLMAEGGSSRNETPDVPLRVPADLLDKTCSLTARVIQARQSTHIGDLFHGIFPRTPEVGAEIRLGIGLLTVAKGYAGRPRVGLMPVENRDGNQWLDIRALYDVHEQTVELIVEEIPAKKCAEVRR